MASPVVATPITDQNNTEQDSVSLGVAANFSDADGTDTVRFSVSGLPAQTGLSIDPSTGVLSGTPTSADSAASPIDAVIRMTDSSGDFSEFTVQLGATGTPSLTPPNVIYRQDGNADPNNLGIPVFTSLAGASGSMSPGDICEVQADTLGGEVFIDEGLDVSGFVGTPTNKYRWQVRATDTAYLYQVDGDCIEGTGASHLQFHGFTLGRIGEPLTAGGTAVNGWSYATQGNNVEHRRTVDFASVTNVRFSNCYFWGGRSYDSANIRTSCPHVGFIDCTFSHTGSQDRSNALTGRADHMVLVRCVFRFNGHDGPSLNGKNIAVIDCLSDGDWDFYFTGDATRPFGLEGSKGVGADWGPALIQGNMFKNGVTSAVSGEPDPCKFISTNGLFRRNYLVNFDRNALSATPLENSALPSSGMVFLHNTLYGIGSLFNTSDINITNAIGAGNIDDGFQHVHFRNNVLAEVGNENAGGTTNQHVRGRYSNVGRSDSDGPNFANAFRGMEFKDNLVDMITGDFYFDLRDGVANIVAETLTDAETNYASLVSGNQQVAPTFVNAANRTSDVLATAKAGLALTGGSNGVGDASATATTTASGTATTSIPVGDARPFAALRDASNYNLDYFSDDLPREYVVVQGNSVVEVVGVNYSTNTLEVASAQTFINGATVWSADSDGTIWDNQGAGQ